MHRNAARTVRPRKSEAAGGRVPERGVGQPLTSTYLSPVLESVGHRFTMPTRRQKYWSAAQDPDEGIYAAQFVGAPLRGNKMSGVSTPQAVTVAIRPGDLVGAIGPDAEPASSPASHIHFDVCPTWLELAIRHLSDAQVAQVARIETWKDADEYSRIGTLKWEFEASIQAIVASGLAVEAFCAVVQSRVELPQSLIDEWRENRTLRCVQISEALRRAFSLEPKNVSSLRQSLGEIFRFRDLAIDPSAKRDTQILHPELGVGVEWRFAYFRYQNALLIVKAALRLIAELVAWGKPKDADLQKYIDALRSSIEPLQNANALRPRARDAHYISGISAYAKSSSPTSES